MFIDAVKKRAYSYFVQETYVGILRVRERENITNVTGSPTRDLCFATVSTETFYLHNSFQMLTWRR